MAVQIQKKKMLCLIRILLEQTDEQHSLTAKELCTELEKYGISAERKSIYSDIDTLRDVGMDILQSKGTSAGYYVGVRMFSMPELKLLVDAVQSSKFITRKKSDELIRKLESLSNDYRVIALIFRDGEAILALAGWFSFADGLPSGGKSLQNLDGIRRRFTASLTPMGDLIDILRDSCGRI